MSGLSDERLAEIRERAHRVTSHPLDAIDDRRTLLAHVDHLTAEVEKWKVRQVGTAREVWRLREGVEEIRDEAWEPWLNRDWQHLDGIRNDCDALLNPPTEGEADHE